MMISAFLFSLLKVSSGECLACAIVPHGHRGSLDDFLVCKLEYRMVPQLEFVKHQVCHFVTLTALNRIAVTGN